MGTGYIGGATHFRSISDNFVNITAVYALKNGYFGQKGQSKNTAVRNLVCENPVREAQKFFSTCAFGGALDRKIEADVKIAKMADGTIITFRKISKSDGSPAVSINIKYGDKNGKIKTQKIHFVGGDK